jgi:hypothetical protein
MNDIANLFFGKARFSSQGLHGDSFFKPFHDGEHLIRGGDGFPFGAAFFFGAGTAFFFGAAVFDDFSNAFAMVSVFFASVFNCLATAFRSRAIFFMTGILHVKGCAITFLLHQYIEKGRGAARRKNNSKTLVSSSSVDFFGSLLNAG